MADRKKPHLVRVRVVNKDGSSVMKTLRMDQIETGRTARSVLSGELKARATALWARVGRQARPNLSLAEWVQGFAADERPELEMDAWDHIANVTDDLWEQGVGKTRDELLRTVINVAVGSVDIPSVVPGATDDVVAKVRERWDREP